MLLIKKRNYSFSHNEELCKKEYKESNHNRNKYAIKTKN